MINVLVAPNKYVPAFAGEPLNGTSATHWFTESRQLPLLQAMPLAEALKQSAPAHVMMYAPPTATSHPRLRKSSIIHYEAHPIEAPTLNALVVDVDYGEHEVPPDDWHTEMLNNLQPPFDQPMWYRTTHGLRLCYELTEPVQLKHAQSYVTQAFEAIRQMGVPADDCAQDWTRLCKLPQHDQDLPKDISPRPPISWTAPEPLTSEDPTMLGTVADVACPVSVKDKFTRRELKALEKVDERLADQIHSGTLSAAVGDRHGTLLRACIRIVWAYRTNDPSIPYNYLAGAAARMGKDLSELWLLCQWAAAAFNGWETQIRNERETMLDKVAQDMRCTPAEVPKRLIIDAGAEQFVWDENDGRYSVGYFKQHQLLPAVDRHCPTLVSDYFTSFAEVLRTHSSHASKLVYTYNDDEAGYEPHTQTMYVAVCQVDPDIRPRFSPLVDEWLQGTFGLSPHGEQFFDWLATVYQITRPTCAVYLEGPPGIGKNLLIQGIARAYGRECPTVEFEKLTHEFNQPLIDSPVVSADEALPRNNRGATESATLRQYIGNTGFRINSKFKTEATIRGYPRIILTANNGDILRFREDMSPDDVAAIQIRIAHLRVPDEADGFLSEMSERHGYKTVREMVDPWVHDGHIAAHILWMAETRDVVEGDRFLVEGWESELTQNLPGTVGASGALVAAIVSAITSGQHYTSIRWFGGDVYVSNPLLTRDWEDLMRSERMPSDLSRVRALKSMSGDETRTLDLPGLGKRRQKMYWRIPGDLIARLAEDRGEVDADVLLASIQRETEPDITAPSSTEVELEDPVEVLARGAKNGR